MIRPKTLFLILLSLAFCFPQSLQAQDFGQEFGFNPPEYIFSGQFKIAEGSRQGKLAITMEISPEWYAYSLEQENNPTIIAVNPSNQYRITGKFTADKKPKKEIDPDLKYEVEKFVDKVTWTAPIEIAAGIEFDKVNFTVEVSGQVCKLDRSGCLPYQEDVSVKYSGFYKDPSITNNPPSPGNIPDGADSKTPGSNGNNSGPKTDAFIINFGRGTLTGYLDKSELFPGDTANLVITAKLEKDNFIFESMPSVPEEINEGVTVILQGKDDSFTWVDQPRPDKNPTPSNVKGLNKHQGEVTWTIPVRVPNNLDTGIEILHGQIGLQACTNQTCDPPLGFDFVALVKIGERATKGQIPLIFSRSSYVNIKDRAQEIQNAIDRQQITADISKITPQPLYEDSDWSLLPILGIALIGGFILNFMPCVLPVIGLKVMSFVQQAGQDRGKVFALNAWYAVGMLSVFWILASLAAFINLGWGEQFNNEIFNVVMISVVFVMALSFIGVWEIPIPGFVSGGTAGKVEQKEGPAGAFFKGVIATVLATPCSGPGLATALAWCAGKEPGIIYLVFTFLGLGMALPYLVIGLNPGLIRFLPRPGAWMETFKHLMGFVLLGTVVFMLTYFKPWLVIPTITALFGLWAACWWIGRVPFAASFSHKTTAWVQASLFAAAIFWFSFPDQIRIGDFTLSSLKRSSMEKLSKLVDTEIGERKKPDGNSAFAILEETKGSGYELESELFSVDRVFEIAQNENKVVMVDFTADWCATCKVFEATVLNTKTVSDTVDEHNVAFMVADWSSRSDDISKVLKALGANDIPVYAIFPPGDPYKPIVLNASNISRANVVAALEKAALQKSGKASDQQTSQASNELQPNKASRF